MNQNLNVFPHSLISKESACNVGELGSIPGSGRSSGERNGNSLLYCRLENPMDRQAWQATVRGIAGVGHDLATKPPPPCICTQDSIESIIFHETKHNYLKSLQDY